MGYFKQFFVVVLKRSSFEGGGGGLSKEWMEGYLKNNFQGDTYSSRVGVGGGVF